MSAATVTAARPAAPPAAPCAPVALDRRRLERAGYAAAGIAMMFGLWWLAGWSLASDPTTQAFAGFAPGPTLAAFWDMLASGYLLEAAAASLWRIVLGLVWSIVIGVPLGVVIGQSRMAREITHVPFQFLRMISPLSWMPVAILVFATWDGAIVFLITAASVWTITFATASGVSKVDPNWFKVARNLGAGPLQMLLTVTLPAIAQDVLTGIRLALGVAWIVLVPAEYLGVTSGLGYAINDARDTLSYDQLAATVLAIGIIGFLLDGIFLAAIRRWSWHE